MKVSLRILYGKPNIFFLALIAQLVENLKHNSIESLKFMT